MLLLLALWLPLAPTLTPRQEVSVAAANGKVYLMGGIAGSEILSSVEEYDPLLDRWRFVASMPQPVHHAAAVAVGDAIYVIGGYRTLRFDPVATVFRYDTRTDAWTRVADLPRVRGALAAAEVDGKIYAVGGVPGTRELTIYDPATDRWTDGAPMPTGREHHAAASFGGRLYVAGGRLGNNSNAFEAYDPATNSWSALPPLPTARSGIAAAVLHGRIYVFGGEGNSRTQSGVFAEVESYDPRARAWRSEPPMRIPRHGIGAAALGNRIHIPAGAPTQGFGLSAEHDALVEDAPPRRRAAGH